MIPIDLSGKIVLITGCDSPETRKVAGRFALAGANLVVQYEKEEEAILCFTDEMNQSGGKVRAFRADLENYRDAERLTGEIIETCRTIDILVNVNKRHSHVPFRELTLEQWNESLQYNLFQTYHICRCVSRSMMERGKGIIINISSSIHFSGLGGGVDFSAAEAAVHGMTLAMAREMTSKGVRVNAIAPAAEHCENHDMIGNFAVFLASPLADRISGEIFKLGGISCQEGGA